MRIYWIKSQAPRRVLALAKHLELDAELIELDFHAGELKAPSYAALNPNLKAPTLVDGDYVLWESAAIMAYLCIKAGSDMWPAHDPAGQVEVLQWMGWNDRHWMPAIDAFYFEHIVKSTFGFGPPDRTKLPQHLPAVQKYSAVLDAHLASRDHVACGRLTIADFHLASVAAYWREAEMPLSDFPHIVRWLERLTALPAWARPWPTTSHKEEHA